jgi:hypothetical protein
MQIPNWGEVFAEYTGFNTPTSKTAPIGLAAPFD